MVGKLAEEQEATRRDAERSTQKGVAAGEKQVRREMRAALDDAVGAFEADRAAFGQREAELHRLLRAAQSSWSENARQVLELYDAVLA